MKKTLFAALIASTAAVGFANGASAQTLLYGNDANDHKSVQVIDPAGLPAVKDNSVAITSSHPAGVYSSGYSAGGQQLLIVPNDRTDGTRHVFY